jgi:adenine phosphoribosyltransferase
MKLINYIRDIQDFPTKGIVFKDITPLLGDKAAFAKACQELVELVGDQQIDKVVGVVYLPKN